MGAIALAPARRRRWRRIDVARMFGALAGALHTAWTQEIDRRRLFLWLPALYAVGIVGYFAAAREPSPWASAVPLAACVIVAVAGRARIGVLITALAFAAFFAGFLTATMRTIRVAAPALAYPVTATLTGLVESIERTSYGGRIVLAVSTFEPAIPAAPQRVRLTFRGDKAVVSGDSVKLRARLTPPGAPSVPGGFDFQREAFFLHLGAVGTVSGGIEFVADAQGKPLLLRLNAAIDAARNALTERIVAVIGGSQGAIAAALVTGKRGQIAEADNDAWRGAGIYHIISISGLHMALAAGLFFWAARLVFTLLPFRALRQHAKKAGALVAMAGTIAYDIFSGHEVATERSMIMTLVMLGAILFDRPALAMRNLAISGLIVMTLRPETVLGPSFQMSFGAVAGLVAYGEFMRARREKKSDASAGRDDRLSVRFLRLAGDFAATSLIAGLATAPFQAFHFHRLNPYGLLGNTLAVPLCSIIVMPAAMAGVVLYPLGLDAPAWWLMGQGVAAISTSAEKVAALAGAITTVPRFSSGVLAGMALALAMLTLAGSRLFRGFGLALAALMLLPAARTQRPEIILGPEGRHALVQTDQGLTLIGRGRPVFSLQQWLPGEADARQPRDPTLSKAADCDTKGCTTRSRSGTTIAQINDPTAFREDCERASIIVTPLRAPAHCSRTARVFDQNYFNRFGATYVYRSTESAEYTLESSRDPRQTRPWLRSTTAKPATNTPNAPNIAPAQNPDVRTPVPAPWDPAMPDGGDTLQ